MPRLFSNLAIYPWLNAGYKKLVKLIKHFIMEITFEIAERIINSKAIIEESMTPYKGIEVSYVGYTDAEGNAFEWEREDGDTEHYAIVSFKAMNTHQLNTAIDEFEAENFDDAVNHNLSMRMSIAKADELSAGMIGTLICHEVQVKDEDGELTDDLALLPKTFAPIKAKVAKKASLADMIASRKAKAEAKVEAPASTGKPVPLTV
jgi:hypothetical protein